MSEPIVYEIPKETIILARSVIESGIEYLNMTRFEHERNLGRTTRKNRAWAERMEADLAEMRSEVERMRRNIAAAGPNATSAKPPR